MQVVCAGQLALRSVQEDATLLMYGQDTPGLGPGRAFSWQAREISCSFHVYMLKSALAKHQVRTGNTCGCDRDQNLSFSKTSQRVDIVLQGCSERLSL